MPSLTKREMKKIQTRLEYMLDKLDGKKKITPAADGPQDEFTNLQIHMSEEIVKIRNKIEKQRNAEKRRENYIESIKLKKELKENIIELDDSMEKMETLYQMIRESPKISQKVKDDRFIIYQKFEGIVQQLSLAIQNDDVDITQYKRPVMKLADLKNTYGENKGRADTHQNMFGEDDADDGRVLGQWREEDEKLDAKLGDVVLILDELKVMNKNLGDEINIRDAVVDEANKDAAKTNKEIDAQNKTLAMVLKKYRAPGKLCLDICLVLVVLGLISVIIMMAVNGKL